MKKTAITLAIIYAALALGAPYIVGDQIERGAHRYFTDDRQIQALAKQGIDLTLTHYDKGYFTSIAAIHLRVRSEAGAPLYEQDFTANITHAPLSLSGLDAAAVSITGSSTPAGIIGEHVPEDFIAAQAQYALISLISGKHHFHTELALAPVKAHAAGDTLNFNGLDAEFIGKADDKGLNHPEFKVNFNGLDTTLESEQIALTIEPFNLNAQSTDANHYRAELDQLAIETRYPQQNLQFSWRVDNLSQRITTLSNEPYISAIGMTFDAFEWRFDGDQHGQMRVEDGDLHIGFIPNGDDYAFHLKVKAKPEFSGAMAAASPVPFNRIDANLTIAPFTHADLSAQLSEVLPQISADPSKSAKVLRSTLQSIMYKNIFAQDMTAQINAVIDGESGQLFSAEGEIHEHLQKDSDAMNLMFDQAKIPRYLHGTNINITASKHLLEQPRIAQQIRRSRAPIAPFINANGDLKLDIEITDSQALINGEPQ